MSNIIRFLRSGAEKPAPRPPAEFQKMVKPLMYFPGGPSQTKLLPNFEDIIVDPEMTQPPGVELPPGMAPLPQRKTYKPGELL